MERLQKVLAQAGIASRRAAEQIILSGRVRVDGKIVTELGTQVDPRRSRVEVDGNKIVAEKLVYIVLHKPRGVVCTLSDPEGRPTILELIKGAGTRLVPVGRLDFHTSGALLCTNDGEFAQGLAHPKKAVPKVYVAKVKGTVDDDALEHFGDRIEIDGRPTQPAQVKRLRFEGDKTWLEITLSEGRNRQVRRLGEATGFPVMRLARLSHAGVDCESLRPGQWRELSLDEMIALKRDYGVPKKIHAPSIDYKKGIQERGEGPAARFDKRTPRTAPKKGAFAPEVRGEHWTRESSRDERFGRDGDTTREAIPRGREAVPRGREAVPRGRDAAPRGRDNTRDAAPRGKRSDGVRRDRTPSAPELRAPNRKAPFARGEPSEARVANRKAPVRRELGQSASQNDLNRPWKARSRSANEARPATNSARPSAGHASSHKDREPAWAKRGGEQKNPREPAWAKGEKPRPRPGNKATVKPGARVSSRRPGTSR